jgi:hypothetical protein
MADSSSSSQLKELLDNGEESRIDAIFNQCNFQTFNMSVKAKLETVQDQQKVAYSVLRCNPVNYVADSAYLLERIQEYGL